LAKAVVGIDIKIDPIIVCKLKQTTKLSIKLITASPPDLFLSYQRVVRRLYNIIPKVLPNKRIDLIKGLRSGKNIYAAKSGA